MPFRFKSHMIYYGRCVDDPDIGFCLLVPVEAGPSYFIVSDVEGLSTHLCIAFGEGEDQTYGSLRETALSRYQNYTTFCVGEFELSDLDQSDYVRVNSKPVQITYKRKEVPKCYTTR